MLILWSENLNGAKFYNFSFTVDGLIEWIADICLGLQIFFTAGQFSTDRILRERQRQDACSKLKNEFLCPNIILWLGHHVCWSRTSKIVHPEVRFVKSFTPKRDFWKIISQTRDLRCPPRVQLLLLHVYGQEYGWYHTEQDWQYHVYHPHYHSHRCNPLCNWISA